jgi:twitching motility protein PilI
VIKSSEQTEIQASNTADVSAASPKLNAPTSWLGFVMGDTHLLINLIDAIEVLPVPQIQPVPLTKHSFLGMTNVRGNLYGVTDLSQFLGLSPTTHKVSNRIVLLNSVQTTQAAILVDSVIGLRNVDAMQKRVGEVPSTVNGSGFFVQESYLDKHNKTWLVLNVDALVRDEQFVKPVLTHQS